MMKVRFLPVRGEPEWKVGSGDRVLCATPCEKWLDPAIPYNYRKDKNGNLMSLGFGQGDEVVDLPDLRDHASTERVQIEVKPRRTGQWVVGIVGVSLFGATAAAGTAFTAVGYGTGSSGLKTAGLITLPIGLAGVAASIYAIVTSGSEVAVTPWNGQSETAGQLAPR
jgi:hypothetical protein